MPPRAVPPVTTGLNPAPQRNATAGGPEALTPTPTAAPVADAVGDDFSGTNVQEQGVDEPDIVKTDGSRVFVLAGAKVLAYDVTGDSPRLLGSLAIDGLPAGAAAARSSGCSSSGPPRRRASGAVTS